MFHSTLTIPYGKLPPPPPRAPPPYGSNYSNRQNACLKHRKARSIYIALDVLMHVLEDMQLYWTKEWDMPWLRAP